MSGRPFRRLVCFGGLLWGANAAGQGTSQPPPVSAATSPALVSYTGQYRQANDPDTIVAVYVKDGRLTFDSERMYPVSLTADSVNHFVVPGTEQRIVFERNEQGRVTGFQDSSGRPGQTSIPFTRINGNTAPLNSGQFYTGTEAMIPARDGVKLHVVVLRPKGSEASGAPLPILLDRTPYGAGGTNQSVNGSKPELAASGYIFVYADIRGRYGSQGQFVMNRPVVHAFGNHTDPARVDESTDAYDTVAWLVKNLPNNNGRVGVLGISYPGFLAMMAGIDHHPAVKAISPQAPMTDVWMGDDFFHNGALRQTYAFDYSIGLESSKTTEFPAEAADTFDFFLKNVNFAGAAAAQKISGFPTAKHIIDEPGYTESWQAMAVQNRLGKPEVPTLETGGFFDQEDMWGTQAEYAVLRQHEAANDPGHKVFLALGPWNHGGWMDAGRTLGRLNFGQPTAIEYRKSIEAPFFEFYLKNRSGFALRDTASFRTGVNQWKYYDQFPPDHGFIPAKLYLGAGGTLGFAAPLASSSPVTYISDPANPIPYRERPIQPTYGKQSQWRTWLAADQKFLNTRADLARFSTAPLDRDTTVTGNIVADLFASTTGTDGDFVVKLIDVYPADAPAGMGGFQRMVVDEIFRGRYRQSFEHPTPIAANEIQEYRWSLHAADHTFLKGHRMLVTVQSTWFPLYDRNPQTFVDRITTAPAAAYRPATISILTSARFPSHLELLRPANEAKAGTGDQTLVGSGKSTGVDSR